MARQYVLARDQRTCQVCGRTNATTVDHIVPITELIAGGGNPYDPENLQILCSRCSGYKDGGPPQRKRRNRFKGTVL